MQDVRKPHGTASPQALLFTIDRMVYSGTAKCRHCGKVARDYPAALML
jgi:hypothetical protein